jgi:hypothetical protein
MTPKQKALDLVDKYYYDTDLLYEDLTWIQAKKCALIAVDEIIEVCDSYVTPYYYEVKQEIENL